MSAPVIIYDGPDTCTRCLGWKRIASSEDGESWKYWAELPPPANLAVQLGVVVPLLCPDCGGTGQAGTPGRTSAQAIQAAAIERLREINPDHPWLKEENEHEQRRNRTRPARPDLLARAGGAGRGRVRRAGAAADRPDRDDGAGRD